VGDILQFRATLPGTDGTEESASVRVLVKETKQKVLPEPTDAWAAEASEFDTVAALRDDLATKLRQIKVMQAQMALRSRALEALIELVQDDPPESLIETEVRERLHDLGHRLEQRHISLEQFLAASGRDRDSLLAELRAEAASAVRADLALRALADAENMEVSDEDLDAVVADMATQAGTTGADLKRRLDRAGRLPAVRSDQRKAKALEWLLDHVGLVDEEGKPVDRSDLEPAAVTQPMDRGATVEAEA
jgi:trigger factor